MEEIKKLDFGDKIENSGLSADGRLSADEFMQFVGGHNELVDVINEIMAALNDSSDYQTDLHIENNMDSKTISTQNGEKCIIKYTFVSNERYGAMSKYTPTGEQGKLEISIKNNAYNDYTVVKTVYVSSGTQNSTDISEYLTNGDNLVMFKCTGQITEKTTPAFVYTVKSTSLSIEAPTFQWWNAFSGDSIVVPFLIGGNINKRLIVNITGEDYYQSYTENLGTIIYTDTPYNYVIPHPNNSGVFNISAYVENIDGTLHTKTVSYNIVCITDEDKNGKYLVVNNVAENAVNWSVNTLFDYSLYDGGSTFTNVFINVTKDGKSVYSSDNASTPTNSKQTFSMSMEIETIDDQDFETIVDMLDNGLRLTDSLKFKTNNSLGFSSFAGAVLYINPKKRSNNQSNYKEFINEIDGTVIPSESINMNYSNDAWVTNENGVNIRRQIAGSKAIINYFPFENECARSGKTIEIKFRAYNIVDYDAPVFTILSTTNDQNGVTKKIGIKVDASQAIIYSSANQIEDNQSYALDDGVDIHLTFVVMPDVYGNKGFNIVYMYLNGKKCREFNYESNDYFANNAPMIIGSEYCDVDLYGIRVYDSALNSTGIMKNYVNWLDTTEEKNKFQEENDLYDAEGTAIDYFKAKKKHNVCVFSSIIPSKLYQSSQTGTMEFFFVDHPQNNLSITNFKISGQGSSSKLYWMWNWKGKIDKTKSVITYADGTTTTKKCQMFPGKPDISVITAKLNWASESQDRKMGTCALYNDIFKELGFTNDAINHDSRVRVAIYQEPFVMFEKSVNEEGTTIYKYCGEYTIGYDKGDPQCFGFDTDKFPNLLAIEGSDNSPLPTLFKVPWTSNRITYSPDDEGFVYNGALCYDVNAGSENNISSFISAYNFVHSCSDLILPFNGTLEELNAQSGELCKTGKMYWIAKPGDKNQYNVYYYEFGTLRFEEDDCGDGCINLNEQLVDKGFGLSSADISGKTPEELNNLFILARKKRFKQGLGDYFDVEDALLHSCFVEFTAGSDQRAKNTYTYNFGTLGAKWKWRIDDTDTIWKTDNQGLLKKKYSCEVHDKYNNGKPVWNGAENVFWNLLEDNETFKNERSNVMARMLAAMESLGGLKSGTSYDKIYACYQKYYVTNGKNKFPAVLVNEQAKFYEQAKLQYINGNYTNDTDPISQIVGDCYYPDTSFVKKRINYICSKYNYGFYTAKSSDSISVRAAGTLIKYQITPAVDMYVSVVNGESVINAGRTFAGEEREVIVNLGGSSDQQNNILGASYLMDIGDWHDKQVVGTLNIKGKMLRNLTLGSKTDDIVIAIDSLSISDCGSLQNLELSNISTLSGVLKLSSCTHIKNIYAKGTSISQIVLPEGGGLEHIEYPSTIQYITLRNFPILKSSGVDLSDCMGNITDFFVADCPNMNPAILLNDIIAYQRESQGSNHVLKRIRAVWRGEVVFDENGSAVLDNLANLTDGTYSGLDNEGLSGTEKYPVLDGALTVNANCYEDSVQLLRDSFPKLNLTILGECYIRFKDPEVQRILVAKYGDGTGISESDLIKITYIPSQMFQNNTVIRDFSDLSKLKYCQQIGNQAFYGSTNLCEVTFPEKLYNIGQEAFYGTKSLEVDINIPNLNLTSNNYGMFKGSGITSISNFGVGTFLPAECFAECKNLKTAILPKTLQKCGNSIFMNCTNLESVNLNDLPNLTILGEHSFYGCTSLKGEVRLPKLKWTKNTNAYHVFCNTSIEKVTDLGESEAVPYEAFTNCKNLKSVVFNDNMLLIAANAFLNCTNLESVNLNDLPNLTTLRSQSFYGCTSLKGEVRLPKLKWQKGDNAYNVFCNTSIEKVTDFGESEEVPSNAFTNCKNLKSVVFNDNMLQICSSAFMGCTNLENVVWGKNINSIQPQAFYNSGITGDLNLPSLHILPSQNYYNIFYGTNLSSVSDLGVTEYIPANMFVNCFNLRYVVIPKTVISVTMNFVNACRNLEYIKILATAPPTAAGSMSVGNQMYKIYVPDESVELYKNATGWSAYNTRIFPISQLK